MLGFTSIAGGPLASTILSGSSSSVIVTSFSGLSKAPARGLSKMTMIDINVPTYRATTSDTKSDTISSITYLVDGLPI